MQATRILLDGQEFDYAKRNDCHYLIGTKDVKGVIIVNKDYDKALIQARTVMNKVLKENKVY